MRRFVETWLVIASLLTVATTQVQTKPLSNDDVTQMVALGIGDDVIIDKIRSAAATNFDTSIDGLKALKAAKVSDAVLKAMINSRGSPSGTDAVRIAGISAGGKWMEYQSQDKMGAHQIRFELDGDNILRGGTASPKVILFCGDGKIELSDFRPNISVASRKVGVRVNVDDHESHQSWQSVNGHFLKMDGQTTHELISAKILKLALDTPDGPQTAQFSPAGLDPNLVKQACGDSVFVGESAVAKDLEYPLDLSVVSAGKWHNTSTPDVCWMNLQSPEGTSYSVQSTGGMFGCSYFEQGTHLHGKFRTVILSGDFIEIVYQQKGKTKTQDWKLTSQGKY
jgi:hypothetical protein